VYSAGFWICHRSTLLEVWNVALILTVAPPDGTVAAAEVAVATTLPARLVTVNSTRTLLAATLSMF
jgi:hypothetical protein